MTMEKFVMNMAYREKTHTTVMITCMCVYSKIIEYHNVKEKKRK